MKPISQYKSAILAILFGVALISCHSHSDAPTDTSKMSISFRVETRNGDQGNAGDTEATDDRYEAATEWENYIDIDKGDYRIAFFDNDNRCITPFSPSSISAVEESGYVEYTLEGKVPGILTLYSDFKIVVLANWGADNYPEIKTGVTTIDNLCCPNDGSTKGQFLAFDGFGFKEEEADRYVPMYGVKEYKGVKFGLNNENEPTVLYEGGTFGPVNMLRALAKVEVVFDTEDDYLLDPSKNITIANYNSYGYCAPEKCYEERDYYHSSWIQDYRQGWLHLVGGHNDGLTKDPLNMTKTTTTDGKEVWVAYLPEYRNVALADDKTDCSNGSYAITSITPARIEVPFLRDGKEHKSYIDFAKYTDGEPDALMNIERNNLYRFTITHVDQGIKWKVEALPWNTLLHEEIVM